MVEESVIDQYSSHATDHRFKNASYYALFMRIRVVRRLERFEKSVSTKKTSNAYLSNCL